MDIKIRDGETKIRISNAERRWLSNAAALMDSVARNYDSEPGKPIKAAAEIAARLASNLEPMSKPKVNS